MSDDMLNDFVIEAIELFDEAEDSLLAFEKGEDIENHFNAVFRSFQSIKGAAGMFGLEKLQSHMHFVENLLEKKKANPNLSEALVDYLLNSVDAGRKILNEEEVEFSYYDPDASQSNKEETAPVENIDAGLKKSIVEISNKRAERSNLDGHIFIVDDEPDILDILSTQIQELNYTTTCFTEASEALKALKTTTPDLIITDIRMPNMNGIELMCEVNKIKPHLPVIVVSGFITKEVCLSAVNCGVSGIIEKPFDMESIKSSVDICINRNKNIKLLNKSLDLIVYQFEAFDKYLTDSGELAKRDTIRAELKKILQQKKKLYENLR